MITRMVVRSIRLRPPPHSSAGIAPRRQSSRFRRETRALAELNRFAAELFLERPCERPKTPTFPWKLRLPALRRRDGLPPAENWPRLQDLRVICDRWANMPLSYPHHRRRWHEKRKRNAGRKPRSERNAPSAKPRRDWASVSPDRSEAQSPVRLLRSASDAMRNCLPRPIASQDQLRLRTCSMGISGSEGSRKATRPRARCSESLCELRRLTIRAPCNICPRASIATNGRTGKITPAMRVSLRNRAANDAASGGTRSGSRAAPGSPDEDSAFGPDQRPKPASEFRQRRLRSASASSSVG